MHYIIYKNNKKKFPIKTKDVGMSKNCLIPNHTVLTKPQNKNVGCYTQLLQILHVYHENIKPYI